MEKEVYETNMERAERLNGLLAMLGVVAALGAYAVTGQIIPGLWWISRDFGPFIFVSVAQLERATAF